MNCTDETVGVLLADYYAGQLTPDAWLVVQSHVLECDACRKSLALMMTLGGSPAREQYRSGHVAPEELARFFRVEPGMLQADRAAIERHLEGCELCRREYQFLGDLEAELASAAAADPGRSSYWQAWRAAWRFARRPVVAWAVVLILAYPALRWTVDRIGPARETAYTQVVGPLQRLSQSRRGAEVKNEVTRAADQPFLRLALPLYALPGEMDYRFEFVRGKDKVAVRPQTIANFQKDGEIDLLVDASALDDADYVLTVVETKKGTDTVNASRSYPFKLVTRP